jgi:NTE family protein
MGGWCIKIDKVQMEIFGSKDSQLFKRTCNYILTGALCFLSFFESFGQEDNKPKIGLVLSGGGAKGIAHVGVLKSLEAAGIRPDIIAGTSMGSIVGGLYSIGYSASQIEEMLLAVDWNMVLSNEVPLRYIAIEEKEYYSRYLVDFAVEGNKIRLPSGLIEGQMLSELFQYFLWPALKYSHFDEFPIPFRCIGTDLSTGAPIIFESGSLFKAIRSSMAMPAAFTAVDLDTTYAVDGGLVENFPVELVKSMGADYIIGVNVSSTTLDGGETPETIGAIAMTVAMIGSSLRYKTEIDLCDIYVEPVLKDYSAGDFTNAAEILAIGDEAGLRHLEEFKSLALKLNRTDTFFSMPDATPVKVDTIVLKGNSLFSDALITSKLGIDVSKPIDRAMLLEGIRRVYGLNGFNRVEYGIGSWETDASELQIKLAERSKTRLFTSFHVDNVFATGILFNLSTRDLLTKESRTFFLLDVSSTPKFRVDHYKYIGKEKRFAANIRYNYITEELPSYAQGELIDIVLNRNHTVDLNMLTTQSLRQSFVVGGFYRFFSSKDRFKNITPEGLNKITGNEWGARFAHFYNSFDHRNYTRKGWEIYSQVNAYFQSSYNATYDNRLDTLFWDLGESNLEILPADFDNILAQITPDLYVTLQVQSKGFHAINKRTSITSNAGIGTTLSDADGFNIFEGFNLRAYGYNAREIFANNYAIAGGGIQHVFVDKLFVNAGLDLIGTSTYVPIKDLNFESLENSDWRLGYGLTATMRTRFGPFSGGVSRNTSDSYFRYFFSFGFSFNYSDI